MMHEDPTKFKNLVQERYQYNYDDEQLQRQKKWLEIDFKIMNQHLQGGNENMDQTINRLVKYIFIDNLKLKSYNCSYRRV